MNLILMRHGEATDNVSELISDKEIYWSILTEQGKNNVLKSIDKLPAIIDKIYVSPLPRTIQTAHYVFIKHPKAEVIIENRIREIYYGKYSGQKIMRISTKQGVNKFLEITLFALENMVKTNMILNQDYVLFY